MTEGNISKLRSDIMDIFTDEEYLDDEVLLEFVDNNPRICDELCVDTPQQVVALLRLLDNFRNN